MAKRMGFLPYGATSNQRVLICVGRDLMCDVVPGIFPDRPGTQSPKVLHHPKEREACEDKEGNRAGNCRASGTIPDKTSDDPIIHTVDQCCNRDTHTEK